MKLNKKIWKSEKEFKSYYELFELLNGNMNYAEYKQHLDIAINNGDISEKEYEKLLDQMEFLNNN